MAIPPSSILASRLPALDGIAAWFFSIKVRAGRRSFCSHDHSTTVVRLCGLVSLHWLPTAIQWPTSRPRQATMDRESGRSLLPSSWLLVLETDMRRHCAPQAGTNISHTAKFHESPLLSENAEPDRLMHEITAWRIHCNSPASTKPPRTP